MNKGNRTAIATILTTLIAATMLLAGSTNAHPQAGRRRTIDAGANPSARGATESLYLQGTRELNAGQHTAALATLDKVIELDPRFVEAHLARGQALAQLKRTGEAVEAFKQAIALAPTTPRAHYELGLLYRTLNEHSSALTSLKEAARLEPSNARTLYELGDTYLRLREVGAATSAFLRAVEIDRAFADANTALIKLLDRDETRASAGAALDGEVGVRPLSAPARYYFALALYHSGRRKDALKQQKVLEKLDPTLAAKLQQQIGL